MFFRHPARSGEKFSPNGYLFSLWTFVYSSGYANLELPTEPHHTNNGRSTTGGSDQVKDLMDKIAHCPPSGCLLHIPCGTYDVDSEIAIATAQGGLLEISGEGACSRLNVTGTNKGLHIIGIAGITRSKLILRDFAIISHSESMSPALLHLDGISDWFLEGLWLDCNNKAIDGVLISGSQQGQISGGDIASCVNSGHIQPHGLVHSNGIDWHGTTLWNASSVAGLLIDRDGSDDLFFHGNHVTGVEGTRSMMDLSGSGIGPISLMDNHFEPVTASTACLVLRSGRFEVIGNVCYGQTGGTDLEIMSDVTAKIIANQFNQRLRIDKGATDTVLAFNELGGEVIDAGTRTRACENHNFNGRPLDTCNIFDRLVVNPLTLHTVGDIATFIPPPISGPWGITIDGAGASQDIYARFGMLGPTIGAVTGGADVRFKSAPEGILWAYINRSGLNLSGAVSGTATLSAPATGGVTSTLPETAGPLVALVASGTSRLPNSTILPGSCAELVSTPATGAVATDVVQWAFNSAPTDPDGKLSYTWFLTSGHVNWKVCNGTPENLASSGLVINWKILR